MAFCQVCNKTKQFGHKVSHSKRRTKRVFNPNVFRKRMLVGDSLERIKICHKCLKRAKKFGEVKADRNALLAGCVVKRVDWAERANEKARPETGAETIPSVKGGEQEEKKEEEGVSVEEIVGG